MLRLKSEVNQLCSEPGGVDNGFILRKRSTLQHNDCLQVHNRFERGINITLSTANSIWRSTVAALRKLRNIGDSKRFRGNHAIRDDNFKIHGMMGFSDNPERRFSSFNPLANRETQEAPCPIHHWFAARSTQSVNRCFSHLMSL